MTQFSPTPPLHYDRFEEHLDELTKAIGDKNQRLRVKENRLEIEKRCFTSTVKSVLGHFIALLSCGKFKPWREYHLHVISKEVINQLLKPNLHYFGYTTSVAEQVTALFKKMHQQAPLHKSDIEKDQREVEQLIEEGKKKYKKLIYDGLIVVKRADEPIDFNQIGGAEGTFSGTKQRGEGQRSSLSKPTQTTQSVTQTINNAIREPLDHLNSSAEQNQSNNNKEEDRERFLNIHNGQECAFPPLRLQDAHNNRHSENSDGQPQAVDNQQTNLTNTTQLVNNVSQEQVEDINSQLNKNAIENNGPKSPQVKNQNRWNLGKFFRRQAQPRTQPFSPLIAQASVQNAQPMSPGNRPSGPISLANQAISRLSVELCERLIRKNPHENLTLSSLGIILALDLYLICMEESSKADFIKALGFPAGTSEEAVHRALGEVAKSMHIPPEDGELNVEQGIAYKPSVTIPDHLIKKTQVHYKPEIIQDNDLQTRVNTWVSDKTHGKIPTLLDSNDYNFVLLNAIYLKLPWQVPFLEHNTKPQLFTFSDGTSLSVNMMAQTKAFHIYRDQQVEMVEIPYRSPELSLLVFLPKDYEKLGEIESQLTADKIRHYRDTSKVEKKVELWLPRIKLKQTVDLLPILEEEMGFPIRKGLSAEIKGQAGGSIEITEVKHKTFVQMNEKGTEAAAVTGVYSLENAMCSMDPPPTFHIDRPYAFFVMKGDTIVFRGRVCDKKAFN